MRRLLFLTVLTVFTVAPAMAQASAVGARPAGKDQFFPVDQVRPGMRAVGYTVFEGSEPQPFDVEILGVLKGFPNPQQSAILSRLLGTKLDHTGVFQGMSGSPVYIEGKLLGAVAFGYQFAKDPIAGITPIQQMIDIFEKQPGPEKGSNQPRSVSFSEIAFSEKSAEFTKFVTGGGQSGLQTVSGPAGSPVLMPIATPLSITGVSPEVVARFAPHFQSLGLAPVAGVGGSAGMGPIKSFDDKTLRPGSTVVVPLVRGDFSIAAAGTVTYRDGSRVYAFGHPFLSVGVSDFPMNEGEVVTVMSSAATSFKLSIPGEMVGAVRGDRSSGIFGELGSTPRMIPFEIDLRTSLGAKQTYRFEMVSDRFLTPILMQMTTLSAISSTERLIGDSTLQVRGRVKVKGQSEVTFENRLTTSVNAPLAAAFAVSQPVSVLLNSGFNELEVEKVALEITSVDARNKGQLDRLWIDRTDVRRGEKIEVQAFARTENGGEYVEKVTVEIPKDAPLGELRVIVSDGGVLQASEPRTSITPKSLSHLVRELNRLRKTDRLYVRLERSDAGVVINNEELPSLPPSVLATLGSDRTAGGYTLTRAASIYEKELPPAEFVISGQRMLTINVVN